MNLAWTYKRSFTVKPSLSTHRQTYYYFYIKIEKPIFFKFQQIFNFVFTCMESKKKNMISSEREAPTGRHMACNESSVVTLLSPRFLSSSLHSSAPAPLLSSMAMERNDPQTMRRMDMKKVDTLDESIIVYARWQVSGKKT